MTTEKQAETIIEVLINIRKILDEINDRQKTILAWIKDIEYNQRGVRTQ